MSYQETVTDIEKSLGSFPGFFKGVPQDVLMQMWPIFKRYSLGESRIPPKDREMIGLAVAATIKCPYCETFHKGAAQMNGATDEEFLFSLASVFSQRFLHLSDFVLGLSRVHYPYGSEWACLAKAFPAVINWFSISNDDQ